MAAVDAAAKGGEKKSNKFPTNWIFLCHISPPFCPYCELCLWASLAPIGWRTRSTAVYVTVPLHSFVLVFFNKLYKHDLLKLRRAEENNIKKKNKNEILKTFRRIIKYI